MVKAILENRKTITRRIVKFPEGQTGRLPENGFGFGEPYLFYPCGIKRPKYQLDDVLWVRETWCRADDGIYFKADSTPDSERQRIDYGYKWRPSIFMPKEACRIFLRVVGIRVEKLQEIENQEAMIEVGHECRKNECSIYGHCSDLRSWVDCFHVLWDEINAERGYSWDSNPWVWVYRFVRCENPTD